ncbi:MULTISPECIES: hypothetical protein [unclassified Microbacterium]|uniref:hypothetical protein n=1 Tax=unclassified Microbacterium TaxID=2609290 RepID=UPI001AC52E9A|nr:MULTISPECIES: hypothetical protein [unclassified Microbacterium]MBN9215909.1 hypothetical protein [Microbacterium sp.]
MARRTARGAMVGAVVLTLALVTACTPDPEPTPTPTGFASEEEAFAAAEATYRAYVDALNRSRTDASAVPPPESFLSGDALTQSIEVDQQLADAGLQLVGPAVVIGIQGIEWRAESASIGACMDYTEARVVDSAGTDVTPADRPNRASLIIEVVFAAPAPLIVQSNVGDQEC